MRSDIKWVPTLSSVLTLATLSECKVSLKTMYLSFIGLWYMVISRMYVWWLIQVQVLITSH